MEQFSTNIGEIIADKQIDTLEIQNLKEKYKINHETITSLSRQSWIELFETLKKQEGIQNISDLQNMLGVKADSKFGKNSWKNLTETKSDYQNQRISIGEIIQNNQINLDKLDIFLDAHNISYEYVQTQNFDTMRNLLMKIKINQGTHVVKKLQKILGFEPKDIDGEIGRKTWKALLDYQKNHSQNTDTSEAKKTVTKKSWGNFGISKKSGLWGNKGEIRVIPGYNINKILGKTVISNHRAEISYFGKTHHTEEQKEHEENPIFNFQNNTQNHEQKNLFANISQNIFTTQNPFEVNKTHNHDILNMSHSHNTVAWNDYHNGFDYTVNPLHQNISYTQNNKKIGLQNYQEHDNKISQLYTSHKTLKDDSISITSGNIGSIKTDEEKNIFGNFSWQNYDYFEENNQTTNSIYYGGNIYLDSKNNEIISGNIGSARNTTWENEKTIATLTYGANIHALHNQEMLISPNLFLEGKISYQLKSFSCNSNLQYSIWQHAQSISNNNNCYDSHHSISNYYQRYSTPGETHSEMGISYGYKIHPDHVLKLSLDRQQKENNLGISYKFQY